MTENTHMLAEQAAAAFYGQDAASFAKEVTAIAGHDPRLIAVFQRTREHYLSKNAAQAEDRR